MNNIAASVRQRLYNLALARQDDFQRILTQYALERFLYRLSQSPHESRFILKGALVFLLWMDEPHRHTRDLDLLGSGSPAPEQVAELFKEICALSVEPDGLRFDETTVTAKAIREDNLYGGIRVTLLCLLDKARVPIQIDVGFGDAVTPEPNAIDFPVLLDMPVPRLRAYSHETVIAEKLSAMIELDLANSRMKDFFDIWILGKQFAFDGKQLANAIAATFARRKVEIPTAIPTALTLRFALNPAKQTQWQAFVRQNLSSSWQELSLEEVSVFLADFLIPVLTELKAKHQFQGEWLPGGSWRIREEPLPSD